MRESVEYAESYLTDKIYIFDGNGKIEVIPEPPGLVDKRFRQRLKNCKDLHIHEILARKPESPNTYFMCLCGKYGFVVK